MHPLVREARPPHSPFWGAMAAVALGFFGVIATALMLAALALCTLDVPALAPKIGPRVTERVELPELVTVREYGHIEKWRTAETVTLRASDTFWIYGKLVIEDEGCTLTLDPIDRPPIQHTCSGTTGRRVR